MATFRRVVVVVVVALLASAQVMAMRVLSSDELALATASYGDRQACVKDALECETVVCGITGCEDTICGWDPALEICKKRACSGGTFDTCVSCAPICETQCEADTTGATVCVVTFKGTWNEELEECVACTQLWVPPMCVQQDCKTSPMPTEPPDPPPPPPGP